MTTTTCNLPGCSCRTEVEQPTLSLDRRRLIAQQRTEAANEAANLRRIERNLAAYGVKA